MPPPTTPPRLAPLPPATVAVIAKAPVPGAVKTRLVPPLTPAGAAAVAAASLADTLETAGRCTAARRVLVLDGAAGDWLPAGWEVLAQRGDGLDERLDAALEDLGGPTVLIGMDTPQVTVALLEEALGALRCHDGVIGPARDGGWWLLGLRAPRCGLLTGVPMSTPRTGAATRARLAASCDGVATLPILRDVDRYDDAVDVARRCPGSRFARALAALQVHGPALEEARS